MIGYTLLLSRQELVFHNIDSKPIPSLLRNFSAPVKLEYLYTQEELYFLMVHDTDGFNRWNAGQSLASQVITSLQSGESDEIDKASAVISKAFKLILNDSLNKKEVDKAMLAHILELPTEGALIEQRSWRCR